MQSATKRINSFGARAVTRIGVMTVAEGSIETAQEYINPVLQELAYGAGMDVPDQEWLNGEDGVSMDFGKPMRKCSSLCFQSLYSAGVRVLFRTRCVLLSLMLQVIASCSHLARTKRILMLSGWNQRRGAQALPPPHWIQ